MQGFLFGVKKMTAVLRKQVFCQVVTDLQNGIICHYESKTYAGRQGKARQGKARQGKAGLVSIISTQNCRNRRVSELNLKYPHLQRTKS
jgi:hypothetical protein